MPDLSHLTPVTKRDDPTTRGGWIGIDATQRKFARQFRRLMEEAPQLMTKVYEDPVKPVVLYRAMLEQFDGKYPPYPAQQIGDCVSFGHGHGNDLLQCVEIALGEPTAFKETDTEFIYATSREVAGILGNSDGSYGSAAVKAMQQMGVVSREMLGNDGPYSGKRAKAWGKTGAPKSAKDLAAPYKLGGAALVKSWDELVASITNGYPVTICSNQGFTMTRDQDGFCRGKGQWGHCMLIAGVRFDRAGACIMQSWGANVPDGPTVLDQPDFSFWAERSTIENILGEGDSWALSKSPDFAPRPMPARWQWNLAA